MWILGFLVGLVVVLAVALLARGHIRRRTDARTRV